MSAGNLDELLQLWQESLAVYGGEAPFFNHEHLYDKVDEIPIGGVPWQHFVMSYNGPCAENGTLPWMKNDYEVYFRDPHHLLSDMLANPQFAEDFDYMPEQQFDMNGSHKYKHFMSGDWAWKQAV
jgi:hypothetical protein